jgi:hypothetical protein
MLKFRVTNVTARDGKAGRAKFLVEAGRLLQPGECTPVNRLVQGTREDADLLIEEGEFHPIPTAPRKQVMDEDDENGEPIKFEAGAAQLVTTTPTSRSVPLNPGADDDAGDVPQSAKADDGPLSSDPLDDEIKSAKASSDEAPVGFADATPAKASGGKKNRG